MKALIVKKDSLIYKLLDLDTNLYIEAFVKGKLRHQKLDKDSKFNFNKSNKTKKDIKILQIIPKVGDICTYEKSNDRYLIKDIKERKNDLIRPDIANVDQAILVFSVVEPNFSFNLLDTFLFISYYNHIKPILLITKTDIDENKTIELKEKLNYYKNNLDLEIYYINNNLFDFSQNHLFENKITVITGQTGVGKSSFLNNLSTDINQKTQSISKALGRGKHTTRNTELFYIYNGFIADTPGFSQVKINLKDPNLLKDYYLDFKKLEKKCKFLNKCNHININSNLCEVVKKYDDKEIILERYENYRKFYNEIKNMKKIY